MASFDENGKYIKTNWKAGDKITATKLNKIEESIEAVNDNDISRHVEADARLDALEAKDVTHDKELTNIKNTIADNKAAAELGDYEINSRMQFLEQELNEGIEEVNNVASTVDGKIAQGKADMEAMVAEVEADLEGLHSKDEELTSQLAKNTNKIPHVNVKDFGAVGDGITDDSQAIQEAINTGYNVFIPEGEFLVRDTLYLDTSLEFFGVNRAKSSLNVPYDFGENKPVLQIDSQKVHIHGFAIKGNVGNSENITHDKKYPSTCGIAIHIPTTSNRQWSRIENLFITNMDIGLSYNATYYHNVSRVEVHDCNKGIVFTNKPVGAINIYDSHIRDNRLAGVYSEGGNNINITNCTFEWNKYHIRTTDSMGDGGISFTGCYLGDGPYKTIYMEGGIVNIDSCNANYIGGGGGRMTDEYPNGYYPDQEVKDPKNEYITGIIDVQGGELYIKNTTLGRGSWGNAGTTNGTADNGNGIEIKGDSKVVFENITFSEGGLLHSESNKDALEFSNKIKNYVVNGTFSVIDQIPNTITNMDSNDLTYDVVDSPFGGNMLRLSATAASYPTFKFKVPPKLVGKVLLLGMIVGKGTNARNTIIYPINDSYSYLTESEYTKYYYPSQQMSGANRLVTFKSFDYLTGYLYSPIKVNADTGEIRFKLEQLDSTSPAIVDIHSVFLIEKNNFRKIGFLDDETSLI